MNDFLLPGEETRLSTPVAGTEAPPVTPDSFLLPEEVTQRDQLRGVVSVGVETPSATAGRRRSLADQTNLPLPLIADNEDEIAKKQRAKTLYDVAQTDPLVARWLLRNPANASLAQDDVKNLTATGQAVDLLKRFAGGYTVGGFTTLGAWGFDISGVAYDLAARAAERLVPAPEVGAWLDQQGRRARQQAESARAATNTFFGPRPGEGNVVSGLLSGAQSAGANTLLIPAGVARAAVASTRQAASFLAAAMSAGVGAQAFTQAKEKGKDTTAAVAYAVPHMAFEYAFEIAPAYVLLKSIAAGAGLLPFAWNMLRAELLPEQFTTITQNFNEWVNLNPEKTLKQFVSEIPDAAAQTLVATLVGVGMQTGAVKTAQRVVDWAHDQEDSARADPVRQLLKVASESQVRGYSPPTYADFIESANPEGAVWVNAEAFQQQAIAAGVDLASAMPETAAALDDALKFKTDVRIPLGELAAVAPGTALEQSIIPLLRTDPNGPTQEELADKAFVEETKARVENILAEQNFTDAWRESTTTVKGELLAQLNAANRFTPDVNNLKAVFAAALYATQAHRMGVTPEEMYVKYPLDIVAQSLLGDRGFTQPAASFADFAPGSVKNILQREDWTILTAENPNAKPLPPEENAARMAQLRGELDQAGIKYTDVKGKYGGEENSLLIIGVPTEQALDIGKRFGQESVLTKQGLVYADETVNPATGVTEHTTLPEDFYSVIPSTGAAFSVDIDFDKRVPLVKPLKQEDSGGLQKEIEVLQKALDEAADKKQREDLEARVAQLMKSTALFQKGTTADWTYSELARQIDAAKMESAPPQGWKDLIRGLVQKGVKPAEIEATGINEWLDVRAERTQQAVLFPEWFVVLPNGHLSAPFASEEAARAQAQIAVERTAGEKTYTVEQRTASNKITKAEVQEFLRDNGVVLDERILSEGKRGEEPEYRESDTEVEDPDPNYLNERAQERLDEMSDKEKAEELGIEVDELDDSSDDTLLDRLIEQESQYYYEDSDAPQRSTATLSHNGVDYDFDVYYSYGEVSISYDGMDVASGSQRRIDVEDEIRHYAAEHLGVPASEVGTEYGDYVLRGGGDYVEVLFKWPGYHLYSAPHFQNQGGNLLAHMRGNIRAVSIEQLKDSFPDTYARLKAAGRSHAKVFFVEEYQSDWAQGRREAIVTAAKTAGGFSDEAWKALSGKERGERMAAVPESELSATPSVPFINDSAAWLGLLTKRTIRYATEEVGADLVAWTRGDQQVERYRNALRKRVDTIEWTKTTEGVHLVGYKGKPRATDTELDALRERQTALLRRADAITEAPDYDENNNAMRDEATALMTQAQALQREIRARDPTAYRSEVVNTTYAENILSDAIGKAMGDRIKNDPAQSGMIEGDDITIDDVGMSQVYGDASGRKGDGTPAILTKVTNDVLKKLGGGKVGGLRILDTKQGKIEEISENLKPAGWQVVDDGGRFIASFKTAAAAKLALEARYIQPAYELTPALKTKSLAGVPLFQPARGQIVFGRTMQQPTTLTLLANANLSTFFHEMGHFYLELLTDMASQREAPQEVKDDLDRVLDWFGIPDHLPRGKTAVEAWRAMSLDEKRVYHEQFARGVEAYLFEGKAPSVELQPFFQRFRSWMVNVYRNITGAGGMQANYAASINQPLLELTDEVRSVMDRMLATNDEILQAETAREFLPLFESKPAGMSDAEWKAYQDLGAGATQEAVDQLQTRSLRDMKYASNARSRALKRLQAEAADKRKAVRAEVVAEVNAEPVYQAIRGLRRGWTQDDGSVVKVKISTTALAEMYPESMVDRPDLARLTGMTKVDGLHPDQVASLTGFKSGDELVRKLIEAEPSRDKVNGITDQRMLERYGDLADPAALEKAADEAVHNDVRAKFVATELHAAEKAVGDKRTLTTAAKQFAEAMIARKKVRDVKPGIFAAAEARAARAAAKALAADDLAEVAAQKRTQIVNLYATKAAHEALTEVDKAVAYLKKVGDSKAIDIGYREQIHALLERFDLRQVSNKEAEKRASLADWIKAQEAAGFEPLISDSLRNEAFRKPYREMTVEDVRGLTDAVKNIEHLGRLKTRLLTVQSQRNFAAAVDTLAGNITANADKTIPERKISDRGISLIKDYFRGAIAAHRKFSNMVRGFDAFKDGGVAWEYLVRNMNTRGTFEAVENEKATRVLMPLFDVVLKQGRMAVKTYFPDSGKSFSREEIIGMALNMGNAVNAERVMTGERLSPQQLDSILKTLTKEDWTFVQGVWDYLDTFRPMIREKERRLTGVEPTWVEPQPVNTPYGELRGGYYPIAYDPVRSERSGADINAEVQRQMQQGLYTRSTTARGHTKARTESTGRPLRYDFASVISDHVQKVVHDLAWHEYLIDANRLLRAGKVESAIRDHYGVETLKQLKNTLRDIAIGNIGAETGSKTLNYLRYGVSIVGLGWNVFNSIQNMTGITQSMARIGSKWVLKGAVHWAGDALRFESAVSEMYEKSDMMRLRAKTLQREINELRNKVTGEHTKIRDSYFWLMTKTQVVVDTPTWWGQYEKSMADNVPEETAIALADQAVLDAQGGGEIKDLSAVQRTGAGFKLMTTFYGFFNAVFNNITEAAGRTDFKKPKDVASFTADMVLLWTLPALLTTLIATAFKGDWDEEKLTKKLINDQISFLAGTVVGMREAVPAIEAAIGTGEGFGYAGPAALRVFADFYKLGQQVDQGEADEAFWKSLNNVGGILFHYPAGQINKTGSGIAAILDGETDNPGVLVAGAPRR